MCVGKIIGSVILTSKLKKNFYKHVCFKMLHLRNNWRSFYKKNFINIYVIHILSSIVYLNIFLLTDNFINIEKSMFLLKKKDKKTFYYRNENLYLISRTWVAMMLFRTLLKFLHKTKLTNRHLKISNWPQMWRIISTKKISIDI